MAPRPSSKTITGHATPSRTPQPKTRLNFASRPNPQNLEEALSAEHPIEVIGRIRDHSDRKEKQPSLLTASSDGRSIRVRTDVGYRDFSLDGISMAENDDLDHFYRRFVESRIKGVKLGGKCTVMMYGPTGSGKSHTMFGSSKQPGIVYRALRDILGEGDDGNGENRLKCIVHVTVLEIYNEEIYDLLSSNSGGGFSLGWSKGNSSKVKLEVMGGKAKNATFISGTEARKISTEVAKVEKRRIVKSTLCNDQSSRSHCLVIFDVPSVGGRLMLVDMAGSENIEQAGQTGFEAKMQTGKINQGNIALKRVVESIANGESHVPFRDSKLTMLLQDSFEDRNSKILMVLCASPDSKELHKTISTLEYGAKAKCIVRATLTPPAKDKTSEDAMLGSRIEAMDEFIAKLLLDNKLKEKQFKEAQDELLKKEEEMAELRAKLKDAQRRVSENDEEMINLKVSERTKTLKMELERRLEECQAMANRFMEMEKRKMEEKILEQQKELEMLRRRLGEIESEINTPRSSKDENALTELNESRFLKRLSDIYDEGMSAMEKSMELDFDDDDPKFMSNPRDSENVKIKPSWGTEVDGSYNSGFAKRLILSTVFEENEEGEDQENTDEEVKEIISLRDEAPDTDFPPSTLNLKEAMSNYQRDFEDGEHNQGTLGSLLCESDDGRDAAARKTRIQNIFMLCGNHRELALNFKAPPSSCHKSASLGTSVCKESVAESCLKEIIHNQSPFLQENVSPRITDNPMEFGIKKSDNDENMNPLPLLTPVDKLNIMEAQLTRRRNRFQQTDEEEMEGNQSVADKKGEEHTTEVVVKWEASKQKSGKLIKKVMISTESNLVDLRKLVEAHIEHDDDEDFTFLLLGGDPTGAPVAKEEEFTVPVGKLPVFHSQAGSRLACLRPKRKGVEGHLPLNPLENRLPLVVSSPFSTLELNKTQVLLHQETEPNFSSPFIREVLI